MDNEELKIKTEKLRKLMYSDELKAIKGSIKKWELIREWLLDRFCDMEELNLDDKEFIEDIVFSPCPMCMYYQTCEKCPIDEIFLDFDGNPINAFGVFIDIDSDIGDKIDAVYEVLEILYELAN